MKNKTFKKSLSVIMAVLMLLSCWVFFPGMFPEVEAAATLSSYRKADKYGTPCWDGTNTYYSTWNSGSSYTKFTWPKHIYLDKSETLESAGYYYTVKWRYGNNTDYRIVNNGYIFGGWGLDNQGHPENYYTMTKMFKNYDMDASLPTPDTDGGTTQVYDSSNTSGDLYVGVSGLNWSGAKAIIWRNPDQVGADRSAYVFMKGTPNDVGTGTYSTSGAKPSDFGGWQYWSNGWKNASDKYTTSNDSGNWSTDCVINGWKEVAFDITIYDKADLSYGKQKSDTIYNNNVNYANYITAGLDNYVARHEATGNLLKTRVTTQDALNAQLAALTDAANALRFAASNANLLTAISNANAIKNADDYNAKYTYETKKAFETALANATTNTSYDEGVTTYAINFSDNSTWNAGEKANADQTNINNLTNALNNAMTALTGRTYDVTYENMFSFSSWANSASGSIGTPAKGTMTYDIDAGTITIANNGANTQTYPNDHYTSQGFGNGHYNMTLVPGETYTFKYTTSGGTGDQVHIFFFDDNGNAVENRANNGSPFAHAYGTGRGTHTISFTAPEGATKAAFRFGTTVLGDKVTFSDIFMYSHTRGDYADIANWTYSLNRTVFSYGDPLGTTLEVPERTGYTFDGWWVDSINPNGQKDEGEQVTDGTGVVVSTLQNFGITQDWVLHSEWTVNKYTVTWKNEDGTVLETDNNVEYGTMPSYDGETPTKTADGQYIYMFAGWSPEVTEVTGDVTYTATYTKTPVSFTVTWKFANGTEKAETYIYGTTPTAPANTEGYNDIDGHHSYSWPTIDTVIGDVTYEETKNTTDHNFNQQVITDTYKASDATCTAKAKYYYSCSCGEKGTTTFEYGDLAAHTPGAAATCTAPQTCTVCGTVLNVQLAHTYDKQVITDTYKISDASCTAKAVYYYSCSCGAKGTATFEYGDKLAHSLGTWITDKEPTCITPGSKHKECENCDYTLTEAIAATGNHVYGEWKFVNNSSEHTGKCTSDSNCSATITQDHSFTEDIQPKSAEFHDYKCSVCHARGANFNGKPMAGIGESCTADHYEHIENNHSYHYDVCLCSNKTYTPHKTEVVSVIKAPTCTEKGSQEEHCTVCDYTFTKELSSLGHDYKSTVTAPTCTDDGYTTHTCSRCDDSYIDTPVDALGHKWSDTFTSNGDGKDNTHYQTCTVCSAKNTSAHTWDNGVENPVADCKDKGTMTYTCTASGCGATYTEEVELRDHTYGQWIDEKPATCIASGTKGHYECTVCGKYFDEEYNVLDDLTIGTDSNNHKNTESKAQQDPTCTQIGYTAGVYCNDCQIWISGHEEIKALNHAWGEWTETVKATCLAPGEEKRNCKREGCDASETQSIAQLEHSYTGGEYTWDSLSKTHKELCVNGCKQYGNETKCTFNTVVKNPDCYSGGYTTYTCTVCDNSYQADHTEKREHDYAYAAGDGTQHVKTCKYEDCKNEVTENCSGGTAYCNAPAVCEKCNTAWGEKKADNHASAETYKENEKGNNCGVDGYTGDIYYSCCMVLKENGTVIPATGEHKYGDFSHNDGVTTHSKVCSVCGDKVTESCVSGEWVIDKPATCEDAGSQYKSCTVCGFEMEREAITRRPHTEATREENRKEPSCGVDGSYDLVTYCSVCKDVLKTETQVIPATGEHNYVTEVEGTKIPATCKVTGSVTMQCGCGATEVQTLEIDENNHVNIVTDEAVESTCYGTGLTEGSHCGDCGKVLVAQTKTEKKAHTPAEAVTENYVDSTCYAEGSYDEVVYCSVEQCKEKLSSTPKTVEKKEHTPEEAVTENNVAPTCTTDGSYDKVVYCSVEACKYEISREKVTVSKLGHDYTSEVTTEPTCTDPGVRTYTCQNDSTHTYEETINPLNHIDEATVDGKCDRCGADICKHETKDHTESVEATCTTEGNIEYWTCTVCNRNFSDEECTKLVASVVIPALNHKDTLVQVEAKAPTCDEAGWEAYEYCTACDYTTKVELPALNHKDTLVQVEAKAPTCDEAGWNAYEYCTACDYTTKVELPALNHKDTLVQVEAKAPTCDEAGWNAYEYCTACTYTTKVDLPALNHKDTLVQVEAKAPTCDEAGWEAYEYCTACTYTTKVELPALNHKDTLVQVEAKAPTCDEAGWEAYEYCTACTYTTKVELPALNHKDTLVQVEAKAPTCDEAGWNAYEYCTACDYTTYKELGALNHTENTRKETTKEPSCGEDGSYDIVTYCSVCGEVISKVSYTIPATGEHNFITDESTRVDATCVAVGYVIRKCGCGVEIREIIPVDADSHNFSEIGDAPVPGEEPTCIKEGISRHYCTNEGCTVYRKEILPKTEHKYDDVTVVSATCVNIGYNRYDCSESGCNASYDEYYKVDANGEKVLLYPMVDHDYRYVNVAPTCEAEGYTNCICKVCNYAYVDAETIVPAKGHADKDGDGVCDTCKLDAVYGSCTCLCHSNNWFIKIIYKIIRFIWKLLKMNPVCNCGVVHY